MVRGMGPGLRCEVQSQVGPEQARWPKSAHSEEYPLHRGVRINGNCADEMLSIGAWAMRSSLKRDFIN